VVVSCFPPFHRKCASDAKALLSAPLGVARSVERTLENGQILVKYW
jgi:hypothetical protein